MAATLIGRLLSGVIERRRTRQLLNGEVSIDGLQKSIVGRAAPKILTRLGRPSAITQNPANVWYYRLRAGKKRVVAVTFDRGVATRVELIGSPA